MKLTKLNGVTAVVQIQKRITPFLINQIVEAEKKYFGMLDKEQRAISAKKEELDNASSELVGALYKLHLSVVMDTTAPTPVMFGEMYNFYKFSIWAEIFPLIIDRSIITDTELLELIDTPYANEADNFWANQDAMELDREWRSFRSKI